MRSRGAPLKFLATVTLGWIAARIVLLWPQTGSLPEAIRALAPPIFNAQAPVNLVPVSPEPKQPRRPAPTRKIASPIFHRGPTPPLASFPSMAFVDPRPDVTFTLPMATAQLSPDTSAGPGRWSGSGWFVARSGSGPGTAPGGQLGGGQAGVRLAYLLAPRQRVSIFGRVSTPLAGKGSEAAIGIEWQPWQAPVRFAVEQRVGLDGTPGGTGVGVVGGLYRETAGYRLEGYGQAGLIARRRAEPYADGAIRVSRSLTRNVSLGAGAWGGAQRDAQRLDIGPTVTVAVGPARLSLDWRQRIAGRARPGSGPALTLGSDF